MKIPSETISSPATVTVLGVDPGSRVTGWGIVRGPAAGPTLVASGVIKLTPTSSFAERLHRLQQELAAVVERHRPISAGVEAPFHGASPRAALQLAHARGVTLAVLAGAAVEVFEYSPATVKKSVTGNGRAPKEQVARMVTSLLARDGGQLEGGDRADALAVALCHLACVGRGTLRPPIAGRRAAAGEVLNLVRLRR